MKKILLMAVILGCSTAVFADTVYLDSIKVRSLANPQNNESLSLKYGDTVCVSKLWVESFELGEQKSRDNDGYTCASANVKGQDVASFEDVNGKPYLIDIKIN